jgi:hypothetical protein
MVLQVALRFKPSDLNPAELKLLCVFNHSTSNSTTVLLSGTASEPRLVWDVPDNRLFFRPTCVGASSRRQLTVRNASKVPVCWQWALSRKLQGAVSVAPVVSIEWGTQACGTVQGGAGLKDMCQRPNIWCRLAELPCKVHQSVSCGGPHISLRTVARRPLCRWEVDPF